MRDPVLLPPPEADERPLPTWTLPVALLGLAVVASSLLPAVLEHRRLEAYHLRLAEEVRVQEQEVMRLQRAARRVATDRFLRDRALRDLLEPTAD
jgi:hypothetical protein